MSNALTIRQLVKAYDDTTVLKAICNLLERVVGAFNISQTLSPKQVIETSEAIMGDFRAYKLEDFSKCFDMAIKGEFGQLDFNRIDQQVVYGWLNQYDAIRDEQIVAVRKSGAEVLIIGSDDLVPSEKFGELYEKVKQIGKEKKQESDPLENPVKEFYREFDELFRKQDTGKGGIRMVVIDGESYTQDQFIEMKIEKQISKL